MKVGDNAITTKKIQFLKPGEVGIISFLKNDWCVLVYPQNSCYEGDGSNTDKLIKGKPMAVYSHSCLIKEIK